MSSDITQTYADKLPRHALAQRAAAQTPQPGALQTRASAPSLARSLAALDTAEHVSGAAGKARIARAMQHALGNTRIARMGCSSCGDADADAGPLQRRPVGPEGSDQVPPSVERALASSHGQPLPRDTQTRMERAFGASLGDVRVHTGEQSARANRDISAAAFTAGRDIHFAPGRYNPGSAEGQHLLAHELTHVVQQRSGRVPGGSPRIGPAGDAFEHEADQTANAVRRAMAAPAGRLEEDEGGAAASTIMPQRTMNAMHPNMAPQNAKTRRVQAKKLTKEEKEADLQSDDLKGDKRLQTAYDNSPVMSRGEVSEGVKTLQRALKKLNYPLPISFAKTGDADGIFGKETHDIVYQFQVDHKLQQRDGIAGRETLGALDQELLGPQQPACNIQYANGTLDSKDRAAFIQKNFSAQDRPEATKILDDLCAVTGEVLSFASEQELRDEVLKRLRISQYLQESQTVGAFAYPENSRSCPGKTGNALLDAQVNKDAKAYWLGPILEQRAVIKNRHYYFELSPAGKNNAYQALKKLFTPQPNICDKTLIHCDSLITLVKTLAYADTIGEKVFNDKVKSGQLSVWLTYDGMSAKEGDPTATAASVSYRSYTPTSKQNLVIGDHVVFWNHLGYDAISLKNPGPWRLENALLVDKDASGNDLYEGHGAPEVSHTVKPGKEDDVLSNLKDVYNSYAKDALSVTSKVDGADPTAAADLNNRYPQVKKINGVWWVEELPSNQDRPQHYYRLREITDVKDKELIGLQNPYNPAVLNSVTRPVESA